MLKLVKRMMILGAFAVLFVFGSVCADKTALRNNVIRMHVVANSDSKEDQNIKLQVRDAVTNMLYLSMDPNMTIDQAKEYLQDHLTDIEHAANEALLYAGSTDTAKVTLAQETFPKRVYDTFTLPSGVYDALRITIGEGNGKNWWCVVFPALCVGASTSEVEEIAVDAGFSEALMGSLTGEYEIRFYILECIGKLENLLSDS